MRVLGFSKKWPKLSNPEFTTFRYPRKDRDWQVGELVQLVYHPRSKDREVLGTAEIVLKEKRNVNITSTFSDIPQVSYVEAVRDGFVNQVDMVSWFAKTYGGNANPIMNKLTLRKEGVENAIELSS